MIARLIAALMLLASPAAAQDAAEDLHALFEEARAYDVSQNPYLRAAEGDVEARGEWPDISPEAQAERIEAYQGFVDQLEDIDRSALSQDDQLNYDLFAWVMNGRIEEGRFDEARMPFTNDSGLHTSLSSTARNTRIRDAAQAEAWLDRLEAYPAYVDQGIANMRRGIETGWVQPRPIAQAIVDTAKAQIPDEETRDSVYFSPLSYLPETIDAETATDLRNRGARVIDGEIRPALNRLADFLETEYLPAAGEALGARSRPGGEAYYRFVVKDFTTTDMTPEEVHELGLLEVARIRGEMDAIIEEVGFEGSFEDFLEFLRTDPQFYAETPRELLMVASYYAKKADDKMPEFFGKLPRNSYGVRAVPDDIAPNYTTGRYWGGNYIEGRAGGYMVNTFDLTQRPLYNIPSLTLHEGVPGHHHQIALSNELEGLPEFREGLYPTAYGEGWGLYTEKLGVEMDIYETPYEHFGRLSYEMWRACRLVVDTGIHWYGWSREEAEACFLENSALSPLNIRNEVSRYISWPGQALAYKIGELKLWELRARAEAALGEDFDIRAFHDAVLAEGGMPLSLLEAKIDRWIEAELAENNEETRPA